MLADNQPKNPKKFRQCTGSVLAQRMREELVLVDLTTNRIWLLNVTGARIWEHLAESLSVNELCDRSLQDFPKGPKETADIRADVSELLNQMVEAGLLEVV